MLTCKQACLQLHDYIHNCVFVDAGICSRRSLWRKSYMIDVTSSHSSVADTECPDCSHTWSFDCDNSQLPAARQAESSSYMSRFKGSLPSTDISRKVETWIDSCASVSPFCAQNSPLALQVDIVSYVSGEGVSTSHSCHIVGHFQDESLETIGCTGADNQTITNRKYTKHKITDHNTNKLVLRMSRFTRCYFRACAGRNRKQQFSLSLSSP